MTPTPLFLAALLGQPATSPDVPSPLAPGVACPIRSPHGGWAPACPGEEVYRGLLKVVKGKQSTQLQILRDHGMKFLADGAAVRVLSIHDDRSMPLYAPAAEVETLDATGKALEGPFWVPISYLRRHGEKAPPAEAKLPVFYLLPAPGIEPEPGMTMHITGSGSRPVCKDIFAFEEFIKAIGAGDKTGLEELENRKKMAWLDPLTRVLVLDEKTNQFIGKGVPVSEARILNGPYEGQSVWVPNSYLGVLKAQMVSERDAARLSKMAAGRR